MKIDSKLIGQHNGVVLGVDVLENGVKGREI